MRGGSWVRSLFEWVSGHGSVVMIHCLL